MSQDIELDYVRKSDEAADFGDFYLKEYQQKVTKMFIKSAPPIGLFCLFLFYSFRGIATFRMHEFVFICVLWLLCSIAWSIIFDRIVEKRREAFKKEMSCQLKLSDQNINYASDGQTQTLSWDQISRAIYYKNMVVIFANEDAKKDIFAFIQAALQGTKPTGVTEVLYAIVTSNAFTDTTQAQLVEYVNARIK